MLPNRMNVDDALSERERERERENRLLMMMMEQELSTKYEASRSTTLKEYADKMRERTEKYERRVRKHESMCPRRRPSQTTDWVQERMST